MELGFGEGSIHFEEQGTGDVLVLLHGFTESLKIWKDFVSVLSKNFRIITIDLPGHGKSSVLAEVHTMELMADVVKSVLDYLEIPKCVLIGHSMGGYVSLAFSRKYHKQVKGLGLFHSTSLADTEEAKENRSRAIEIIRNNHNSFLLSFIPDLFAPENKSHYQSEIRELIDEAKTMSAQAIIAAQEGMKQRSSTLDVLINAAYPVMFIAGQKDSRIPFENIWVQMALTETTYSLILRNTGHMGYIESKAETLGFIEHFARACYKH